MNSRLVIVGTVPHGEICNVIDLNPTTEELETLETVLSNLRDCIAKGGVIKLPPFDGRDSGSDTAFHLIGIEPNPFGAMLGDFRYQFEGEEDLLHLIVARMDGSEILPEEGQAVAKLVLKAVPPGLIWFKPGRLTQHFSFGHELLES